MPQSFYDTGNELRRYVFTDDTPPTIKESVRRTITRLAELAGVEPVVMPEAVEGWPEECTLKAAARVFYFEMKDDDARRAEWSQLFDALTALAGLSVELYDAKFRARRRSRKRRRLNPANRRRRDRRKFRRETTVGNGSASPPAQSSRLKRLQTRDRARSSGLSY
jgi:hypothetical protein